MWLGGCGIKGSVYIFTSHIPLWITSKEVHIPWTLWYNQIKILYIHSSHNVILPFLILLGFGSWKWASPKVREICTCELFNIRNDLIGKLFSFEAWLRLKISCDACVVDHVTSEPNMARKSFVHQKIVLVSPTSWYTNIRAICFTFLWCLMLGPVMRVFVLVWACYPQKVQAKDLISISTWSTLGGYKLRPQGESKIKLSSAGDAKRTFISS